MKKHAKLLVLVLSLALIIGAIAIVASADNGNVAIIGETEYATLDGDKLTVAVLPDEAQTITLTATFTNGDASTTKEFTDSTVAKILDLVENASSRKSRSEDFIYKFARVYTPIVCFSAMALAVLPPLVSLLVGADPAFGTWA